MRETNTVLLDLETYNKLKNYEQAIENTYFLVSTHSGLYLTVEKDEVIEAMEEEIKRLKDELFSFKHPKVKEIKVQDLKQMSLLSLIKWKLKNK